MKKQLLFLIILSILPAYLYAQISIGETIYESFPDAIAAAVDGDVISVAGTVPLESQVSLLHAEGTLTIKGTSADAKITLADGARFVLEAAGKTIIEDITIVGAEAAHEDWGGMFALFNGPTLILRNDTIRNAKSAQHAGAIRVTAGATVEAYSTVFRDNEAAINGGVFFVEAGNTQLTFEDCLFLNNKAGVASADAKGGAIFLQHGADGLEKIAKNTSFIGNTSSNHGGAIGSESVPMTFVNCTFSQNEAANNGGVLWVFHTAEAFTTTFVNSTLYGNSAGDNGGAIFMNHATTQIDLQNSVVAANTGGGAEIGIAAEVLPATITANNSYFPALVEGLTLSGGSANNLNTGELGIAALEEGVYWHDITSENSVLITLGNPALLQPYSTTDQSGAERDMEAENITAGAIEYSGSTAPPTASQIVIGEVTYETLPMAIEAAVDGDVIEISGAVSLLEQVEFNPASGETFTIKGVTDDARIEFGDARIIVAGPGQSTLEDITLVGYPDFPSVETGGMVVVLNGGWLVMQNDTIRDGSTSQHGGVFLLHSGAKVEAYNSVFRNNDASLNGGVFFANGGGSSVTLENCLFLNNRAGVDNPDAKGGAFSWVLGEGEPGENIAKNCAFIGNSSGNHGGAYASESIPMTFVNCTFSQNEAVDNGGAIWLYDTGGEFTTTFINCTIYGNSVEGSGGAMFMNHPTNLINLQNTVVAENMSSGGIIDINTENGEGVLTARNSFIPELPEAVTLSGGSSANLTTGELYLADLNVEEGIYWHAVTSGESVLVTLGNPNLLKPYSNTDQRGVERNMAASKITTGSFEYGDAPGIPTGVNLSADLNKQILAYPVPATDFITIKTAYDGKISVFNIEGSLVLSKYLEAGENQIDISSLPNNVYFIKNISTNGVRVIRFVKQ